MVNSSIVNQLNGCLANAIVFYQKLHHYHWRIQGEQFFKLHEKFEELYNQWSEIVDDVAERILTIGGAPIGTLKEALAQATINEDQAIPNPHNMVQNVLKDLETQVAHMHEVMSSAESAGDRGTVNLLDGFCDSVEKTCWMLRAYLSK